MRPLIVTTADGSKRRLNPMQIIGWRAADVPTGDAAGSMVYQGTVIALVGGPVGVRESEDQIDWLFVLATSDGPRTGQEALAVSVPPAADPPERHHGER